jgi:CubicO group peptidase (beta-lactamase class C family)
MVTVDAVAYTKSNFAKNFEQESAKIIEELKIPGAAIAIVTNNKIVYRKTFGVTDLTNKKRVTTGTIFQIASLSKAFMGGLLAYMADHKHFSWHENVIHNIKEFKLADRNHSHQLTYHHIGAMQSGLEAYAGGKNLETPTRINIIHSFLNVTQVASIKDKKFSYQYSLLSLLEETVKRKTGQEWDKLLKRHILVPLKMRNTGIDITSIADNNNVAKPHGPNNEILEWETFKVNAAAGLYSNLNDLIKWVQFHLNDGRVDGKQLISKGEMKKMRASNTKILDNDTMMTKNVAIKSLHYGYFWKNYLYTKGKNKYKVIEHNGLIEGMSSIISYLPDKKIGIIVLCNKATFAPELIRLKFLEQLR